MRQFVSILLAIGLFVAGLPLQACGCGCGMSASEPDVKARPSCCHPPREPASDEPMPCGCEHCPAFAAASVERPVAIDAPTRTASLDRLLDDATANFKVIFQGTDAPKPEPDRCLGSTERPIPILLGHLLL